MAAALTPSPIDRALQLYERQSLGRVTAARSATFAIIFFWIWLNYGPAIARENLAPLAGFVLLGLLRWGLMRDAPERGWQPYLFVVLDVLLLTYVLGSPGRTYPADWPWQTVLRQPSYLYFLVVLALTSLSFRPLLVVWAGTCIVIAWTALSLAIAGQPTAILGLAVAASSAMRSDPDALVAYLNPRYVHPDDIAVRAFVTLLVTAILALAADRARRLIYQEAEAARQRTNLARYVAPNMVERLAGLDLAMSTVRNQNAAVLFADIRGFTSMAETMSPEATMGLLRDFHARMAATVFAHQGTLDKFIGDGLMATFGTPETADDDAARALACGRHMLAAVRAWNVDRRLASLPAIAIGVGIHYGPVTMGDIGGAMRFEFAVIGDTVNVASRLEELSARLHLELLASDATVRSAIQTQFDVSWLESVGTVELRGRQGGIVAWSARV